MKILVAGDAHGNNKFLRQALQTAIDYECSYVMQLGDLGYCWPNSGFDKGLPKIISDYSIPFYWIDGNHENHTALQAFLGTKDCSKPIEMEENLFYCPRGSSWTWGDKKFLGFGGAYSVDKPYRDPYVSWWPNEQANYEEIQRALDVGKVDVMFTHDMPWGIDWDKVGEHAQWKISGEFPETEPNRKAIQAIMESSHPEILIHGHMHHRYRDFIQTDPNDFVFGYCTVYGLAHESAEALTIIDTDDLSNLKGHWNDSTTD